MEHPSGSNPAIAGEVRVEGVSFSRFVPNCGIDSTVLETVMEGGMDSSDAVPPHFFSGMRPRATYHGTPPLTRIHLF